MKILILDENSISRLSLHKELDSFGLGPILQADTEKDALKFIEQASASDSPIQLVILAWELPPSDGAPFLKKLRASDTYFNLPVITIVREINEEKLKRVIKVGSSTALARPYKSEKLKSAIKKVI